MAIAYDTSTSGATSATSPKTWSHTVTGSDTYMVVGVNYTVSGAVTGVTYDGVALTQQDSEIFVTDAYYISLWKLKGPATGAHDVSITFTSGSAGGAAISYTGVLGDVDVTGSGQSGASPIDATVITTIENDWLAMITSDDGSNPSAGTDTTLRQIAWAGGTGIFDSNGARAAGSNSLQSTYTGGASHSGYVIMAFSPVAPAVTVQPAITFGANF